MTNDIQSLLLSEMFVPNKRITISGEHFFADKDLYSNFYGVAFFSSFPEADRNPYISPVYAAIPGIIDDFLSDGVAAMPTRPAPHGEILSGILGCIDKKYRSTPAHDKQSLKSKLCCTFEAGVYADGNNININYGTVLPNTLCITENYALTAQLPFSPFSYISMLCGQRTLQSVEYPLSHGPLLPPEDVIIDFAVTAKKLSVKLNDDLCGSIELEYSLDVGATKCERSKLRFDILPPHDDEF